MRSGPWLSLLAMMTVGGAGAHSISYINPVGGEMLTYCDSRHAALDLYVGGACFAAGHIVPDVDGFAVISVVDDIVTPSFTLGQDPNGDGLYENLQHACGSAVVDADSNWDPLIPIVVFVHGPVFGAAFDPCGAPISWGISGSVDHT